MIFDKKNFHNEIQAIPWLSESGDVLTGEEMRKIKLRILSRIRTQTPESPAAVFSRYSFARLVKYLASVLVGLSLIGGTALAADYSKPGDFLYPLKLTKEKVELKLAISDSSKAKLKSKFAGERLKELRDLTADQSGPAAADTSAGTRQVPEGSSKSNLYILNSTTTASMAAGTSVPNNERSLLIKLKARKETEEEVVSALDSLRRLRGSLQATGQIKAAADIQNNLSNLETQAERENIKIPASATDGNNTRAKQDTGIPTPSLDNNRGNKTDGNHENNGQREKPGG